MAIEPPSRGVPGRACVSPQWRHEVGVFVLGALTPTERRRFERHLGACPACRDELVWLAGLRGLLGRLNAAEVAGRPF